MSRQDAQAIDDLSMFCGQQSVFVMTHGLSPDIQGILATLKRLHEASAFVVKLMTGGELSSFVETRAFRNSRRPYYDLEHEPPLRTYLWNEGAFKVTAWETMKQYRQQMEEREHFAPQSLVQFLDTWQESNELCLWFLREQETTDSITSTILDENVDEDEKNLVPFIIPTTHAVELGADDQETRVGLIESYENITRSRDAEQETSEEHNATQTKYRDEIRHLRERAVSTLNVTDTLLLDPLHSPERLPTQPRRTPTTRQNMWQYTPEEFSDLLRDGEYSTKLVANEWINNLLYTTLSLETKIRESPIVANATPCPILMVEQVDNKLDSSSHHVLVTKSSWMTGNEIFALCTVMVHELITSMYVARETLMRLFDEVVTYDHKLLLYNTNRSSFYMQNLSLLEFCRFRGEDIADLITLLMGHFEMIWDPSPINARRRSALLSFAAEIRFYYGVAALDLVREYVILFFDHLWIKSHTRNKVSWVHSTNNDTAGPLRELHELVRQENNQATIRDSTAQVFLKVIQQRVHRIVWLATSDVAKNGRTATVRVPGQPDARIQLSEHMLLLAKRIRFATCTARTFWTRMIMWKRWSYERAELWIRQADRRLGDIQNNVEVLKLYSPRKEEQIARETMLPPPGATIATVAWLGSPLEVARCFAALRLVLFTPNEQVLVQTLWSAKHGEVPAIFVSPFFQIQNRVTTTIRESIRGGTSCRNGDRLRSRNAMNTKVLSTILDMQRFMHTLVSSLITAGLRIYPGLLRLSVQDWVMEDFAGNAPTWSAVSQRDFVLSAHILIQRILRLIVE